MSKVENVFKFDGQTLKWSSGKVSDQKYNNFLEASKKATFQPGQGLIGMVFQEGGSKTVKVSSLGDKYLRKDVAKACGLDECVVTKNNDTVTEVFK